MSFYFNLRRRGSQGGFWQVDYILVEVWYKLIWQVILKKRVREQLVVWVGWDVGSVRCSLGELVGRGVEGEYD